MLPDDRGVRRKEHREVFAPPLTGARTRGVNQELRHVISALNDLERRTNFSATVRHDADVAGEQMCQRIEIARLGRGSPPREAYHSLARRQGIVARSARVGPVSVVIFRLPVVSPRLGSTCDCDVLCHANSPATRIADGLRTLPSVAPKRGTRQKSTIKPGEI